MNTVKIVFAVFLMSLSVSAVSLSCSNISCSGLPDELFSNYYLSGEENGKVFLQVKGGVPSQNLDCSLAEGVYITLKSAHPLFKEIYSTLLSASAIGSKVYIRVKTGTQDCEVAYIRFYT